jgi:protoporphyrin/coproporphyrin ferrochelatase
VKARKIAVILFNLGGPDGPEAVQPFLNNLFKDPRIIGAPAFVRLPLAAFISTTRTPSARANYDRMGGRSPILPETEAQAKALQEKLDRTDGPQLRVFVAMRYWKPFAEDAAAAALAWGAEEAILLPLYPQFSTTTTASAADAWRKAFMRPTRIVCCYPTEPAFIDAHAKAIVEAWRKAGEPPAPRVLFSAHGLPEKIVRGGDPYQWQVEQTCAAVAAKLPADWQNVICYQSRVGPLKWIGPSTIEALEAAAADKRGVIVSPIAFVSEHIETLVELDIEYAEVAHTLGLPFYVRAPALGVDEGFIDTLSGMIEKVLADGREIMNDAGKRICPGQFGACPMHLPGTPR